MSRLGIAFVLPYVGANGIKVVNNVIEIDPLATINVDQVVTNIIYVQEIDVTSILVVGGAVPYTEIQPGNIQNYDVNSVNTVTIDENGIVDCEQIRTNLNNDDSPELVFLHLDNANNLALTINGTNGNSLQVVPTV